MNNYTRVAEAAARKAGKYIMKHFWAKKRVTPKEDGSLFSSVDIMTEKIILRTIASQFPTHNIVSEETLPHGIDAKSTSPYTWYIDPLDGSRNYLSKIPFFCVSIGLARRGTMVCGVVYAPMTNEMFVAEKNKKSTCDGKPITISSQKNLKNCVLGIGWNEHERDRDHALFGKVTELIHHLHRTRKLSSLALELCYVASGRIDGSIFHMPGVWDIAASSLIVKNAGGVVCDFESQHWSPKVQSKELIASNQVLAKKIIEVIT